MGQRDRELEQYITERLAKAETGQVGALYDLGLLYSTGQGVSRNYVEAHKWFNLAAIHGLKRAKVDRLELARDMSNRDIRRAQRQAREWLEGH